MSSSVPPASSTIFVRASASKEILNLTDFPQVRPATAALLFWWIALKQRWGVRSTLLK
jgi:hypothetical protein